LTVLEFTIRDENHRAELIREDALIIGNIAYLNRIENFSHTDHNLNATETKTLVDAYQVALDTAGKIEELLKCQAAFVEVYEAIGGHQYEHDKAMSQDLGVLKMKVEPVGLGHYFAFGEIWQSLDELKAYYLHRFPTVTFSVVDHGNKTVEELRARGHHLVRKGTRMVA
ncbi:MAG: hypothetical protein RSD49_20655, partial [Hafnia sp.]